MRILVTGASGFVGSLLTPALSAEGHEVRALARDPTRVTVNAEIARGDAYTGEGLARALAGIEVAYYLIHSMERLIAPHERFEQRELVSAERFAEAAAAAGVRRIVYLGGLLPAGAAAGGSTGAAAGGSTGAAAGGSTGAAADGNERAGAGAARNGAGPRGQSGGGVNGGAISRHLASRAHVERTLLEAVRDSVALRASIVIGARSRSFRLLVRLVERMPALPLPAWREHRTQPIDARDVIAMLARAASADVGGRTLDVGGPELLSYGTIVKRIADAMLVRRPALSLGANLTPITARVAAAITQEDPLLVLRLMESLTFDLIPADDHAAELFGVRLHTFNAAVERALREWEQSEPLAAR